MIPFAYRRIDREFTAELAELVARDESLVFLGARYSGKRYLLARLRDILRHREGWLVLPLRLLADSPVTSEERVRELLREAIRGLGEQAPPDLPGDDELFGPLDRLVAESGRRVVLLAANVDGMAYHLARRFLQGVQTRVNDWKQMCAVLSGESDFGELVYGPNSEFTCANQYVLQYFAEDLFGEFADHYARVLRIEFASPPAARRKLWELSGGNAFLMRLALWAVIEARARRWDSQGAPVGEGEFPESLKLIGIPGAYGAHVFRFATRMIAQSPASWAGLETLLRGQPLDEIGNAPTQLELAGVGVRETSWPGYRLKFASGMMEDFARGYYDTRRFGDLYARSGQWVEAFRRYKLLQPYERMRPSGINDRAEVEATVSALCAAMHAEAPKGAAAVKAIFVEGINSILGLPAVIFWDRDLKGWHYKESEPGQFADISAQLADISRLLPTVNTETHSLYPLAHGWDRCAVAAILPTLREDRQAAVVAGDVRTKNALSHERMRLAQRLLSHFTEAYSHAVTVQRTQARLEMRDKHVKIISSIFDSLGSDVCDVRHVITMAAKKLRQSGYRRVLFCLVDPKGERIKGVHDDSDDSSVNVAALTDWPLSDPAADLQPYIINRKEWKIIKDASREPLANQQIVRDAKMVGEALVPLLNPSGEAIGTLHVERDDGDVPSREEVEALLEFGKQLAIAIEQGERVNLLQSALDKIPEPVVIFDRLERVRYGNKLAAELLGVQNGWLKALDAGRLVGPRTAALAASVREALESEHRSVNDVKGVGNQRDYRGAVLTDSIQDLREETVGALLHIQDLNYFYQVFEAFRLVAEANDIDSAMNSLLNATQLMGHLWGRLYLIDENNPERLVGKFSYGFQDPQLEADFNAGKIKMPLKSESRYRTWDCIKQGRPLTFCWDVNRENGKEFFTRHGLPVINYNPPYSASQLKRNPSDHWIDLPIIPEGKVLGKLTLHCDPETFKPENFELLKVFFDGMLTAFVNRERQIKQRLRWIGQAAEEAVASSAHNIGSRLASLPALLYQTAAIKDVAELAEWRTRTKGVLATVMQTIERVKDRLVATAVVRPVERDLDEYLEWVVMSTMTDEQTWEFRCSERPLRARVDCFLLELALCELMQNSKDAIQDQKKLRISLTIEPYSRGSIDYLKILYSDNGPGIPEEYKLKIFEYFFSRHREQHQGTGLGLGFVNRVIEAHGGTVREIGREGCGAVFELIIQRYLSGAAPKKEGEDVSHSSGRR